MLGYPSLEAKSIRGDLISRYPLPRTFVNFLHYAKTIAEDLAKSLRWNTLHPNTAA